MEETQQKIILGTEVCINFDEQNFEDDFGIQRYECSHLFVPENCRKDCRKILTNEVIEEIRDEIRNAKASNDNKVVVGFFQTKKNTIKSRERIIKQISCSVFNGSDGACIYETNRQQDAESFSNELSEFIELTGNLDKYMVFEMESNDLRKKLDISIKNGLRNFIMIAGKYDDNDLWADIMLKIRKEEGKAIAIFSKRLHRITKKSYMQQGIDNGATIVCHGKFVGGSDDSGKERVNLYLDNTDMIFKLKSNLPLTNTLISNSVFNDLMDINEGHIENEYHLSRLSALHEGSIYCDTHKRVVIINTSN